MSDAARDVLDALGRFLESRDADPELGANAHVEVVARGTQLVSTDPDVVSGVREQIMGRTSVASVVGAIAQLVSTGILAAVFLFPNSRSLIDSQGTRVSSYRDTEPIAVRVLNWPDHGPTPVPTPSPAPPPTPTPPAPVYPETISVRVLNWPDPNPQPTPPAPVPPLPDPTPPVPVPPPIPDPTPPAPIPDPTPPAPIPDPTPTPQAVLKLPLTAIAVYSGDPSNPLEIEFAAVRDTVDLKSRLAAYQVEWRAWVSTAKAVDDHGLRAAIQSAGGLPVILIYDANGRYYDLTGKPVSLERAGNRPPKSATELVDAFRRMRGK